MLLESGKKGKLTEFHCILDLTELGIRTLVPTDELSKYDVVADIDNKFIRIQCKTASWATDTSEPNVAFYISTSYQTINTKKCTRYLYSKSDIDYFYTYFNGQGYLVPIEEASGSVFRWRYDYPKNGQKVNVHIASDYKIENILRDLRL